jgi:DNA-directed RNA polymerase subunit M/transcription elongation factor TFIIS
MGAIAMMRICRRCGGNCFPARDEEGTYLSCLQCGAVYYLSALKRAAAPGKPVTRHPATPTTHLTPRYQPH